MKTSIQLNLFIQKLLIIKMISCCIHFKTPSFTHISQKSAGRAENDGAAVFCLSHPLRLTHAGHLCYAGLGGHPTPPHPLKSLTVYQTVSKKTGNKLHHRHHPWILTVLTPQNEVLGSQEGRGPLAQPDISCPRANCTCQPVQNTQRPQACPTFFFSSCPQSITHPLVLLKT